MPTPFTVVAVSWTNDGSTVDTSGLSVTAGCKKCPPGVYAQSGPLSGFPQPTFVLVVEFPSLVAAIAWKNNVATDFDLIFWQPTGQCC